MHRLPPPATGVELYLAAIHDRLGEILDRLGGGQEQEPAELAEVLGTAIAVPHDGPPTELGRSARPAKRTRQRSRSS